MSMLLVDNLIYNGNIDLRRNIKVAERLETFSYEFQFGKCYLLDAQIGRGAWALGWIIAGLLSEQAGTIRLDHNPFDREARRKVSWCVRFSEIKRFGFLNLSVKAQIRHGLKNLQTITQQAVAEAQIMRDFNLTPERYNRPLRQFSTEGWRASCAVGFANHKTIFAFPYITDTNVNFVRDNRDLWLAKTFSLLANSGALVLFPSTLTAESEGLCDEVIRV